MVTISLVTQRFFFKAKTSQLLDHFSQNSKHLQKSFISEIINEKVLNSYQLILSVTVLTLLRKRHAKFVKNGGKIIHFHAFKFSFTGKVHLQYRFLLFLMMKSIDLHPTISVLCLFISTASRRFEKQI
jgi:hypothetical protein